VRSAERGAAALFVIGIILLVGGGAFAGLAGEIMNSSEIDTGRGVGAGIAVLGLILVATNKKK
jgi:hypothetical protein